MIFLYDECADRAILHLNQLEPISSVHKRLNKLRYTRVTFSDKTNTTTRKTQFEKICYAWRYLLDSDVDSIILHRDVAKIMDNLCIRVGHGNQETLIPKGWGLTQFIICIYTYIYIYICMRHWRVTVSHQTMSWRLQCIIQIICVKTTWIYSIKYMAKYLLDTLHIIHIENDEMLWDIGRLKTV